MHKKTISKVMAELGRKSWEKRKNKVGEIERLQKLASNRKGKKTASIMDIPLSTG